jgi:hypothetical protein
MAVAINAIRRLESKIEELTTAVNTARSLPAPPPLPAPLVDHRSPYSTFSQPSPVGQVPGFTSTLPHHDRSSVHELAMSPQTVATPGKSPFSVPESSKIALSFSQHRVALWPAVKHVLPAEFSAARADLAQDYIVELESQRAPLPVNIDRPYGTFPDSWLMSLSQSVVKGLAALTLPSSIAILPSWINSSSTPARWARHCPCTWLLGCQDARRRRLCAPFSTPLVRSRIQSP